MRNNTAATADGSDRSIEVFSSFFFFLRIGGVEVEWRKNEVEIWDL